MFRLECTLFFVVFAVFIVGLFVDAWGKKSGGLGYKASDP